MWQAIFSSVVFEVFIFHLEVVGAFIFTVEVEFIFLVRVAEVALCIYISC